jgi:5-formyltetrahydrofolate cyclo-ligase
MTAIPDDLRALRRDVRAQRNSLSPAVRILAAQRLAERLDALGAAPERGRVAGYWATGGEIALHAWQVALPREVDYCLPVLHEDGLLRFAPWRPGEPLVPNRFGIPEPAIATDMLLDARELELVIAPLVAFDAACNRVGMGGGWYDRTFAFRREQPTPKLVGAAYELQRVDSIAAAPWDVPLDAVCTEVATYLREPNAQ